MSPGAVLSRLQGQGERRTTWETNGGRLMLGSPVVFVSYSRKDAKWRDKFLVMLTPDVREERLDLWTDQREVVGEEWRPQLDNAISRSIAALLLVSPAFLASEFIMEQELPALVAQGVRLVCALIRDCRWQAVPALERIQWAHDPERPLMQERNRDREIVHICKRLVELLPPTAAAERSRDGEGKTGGDATARVT